MSVICKLIDSLGRKFRLKKCAMNAWKYFSHSDSIKKVNFLQLYLYGLESFSDGN